MSDAARPVEVWDAPIRLFHWGIVFFFLVSYTSISLDWIRLHFLSGYCMLTLLLFRLAWGVIGSDSARFSTFLRPPEAGLRHLRRLLVREPDTEVGHNAAGGWMVILLLLLLGLQVGTGLFSNEDGKVFAPLAGLVGRSVSDTLAAVHGFNFNLLLGAVILHLCAIAAYRVLKGQDLVRPMLTGRKILPASLPAPLLRSPLLAVAAFGVAAAAVWALVTKLGVH